jgi:hypothetical protein
MCPSTRNECMRLNLGRLYIQVLLPSALYTVVKLLNQTAFPSRAKEAKKPIENVAWYVPEGAKMFWKRSKVSLVPYRKLNDDFPVLQPVPHLRHRLPYPFLFTVLKEKPSACSENQPQLIKANCGYVTAVKQVVGCSCKHTCSTITITRPELRSTLQRYKV